MLVEDIKSKAKDAVDYPVMSTVEIIDARELAKRWRVPETWVRNWTREGYANDPIPHVKLGHYVRFEWGSLSLSKWWDKRRR